jgi:hypothetical protein
MYQGYSLYQAVQSFPKAEQSRFIQPELLRTNHPTPKSDCNCSYKNNK